MNPWTWLDGKKTNIGSALLFSDAIYEQVLKGIWHMAENPTIESATHTAMWVGVVLTGGGLTHKGVKIIQTRKEGTK